MAIDTETNGKDVRDGRGVCYGISFATDTEAFYLPFRHITEPEQNLDFHQFRDLIQRILDTKKIIYFNAQFDIVSLGTLGLNAKQENFFCTQVLAHLIDENRPFAGKSLDAVTKMYLADGGKRKDPDYQLCLDIYGYEKMPADATAEYAAWDAKLTYDLFFVFRPKLIELGLREVWEHKRKMILRLIQMEKYGVAVDENRCWDMAAEGYDHMQRYKRELGGLNPSSGPDLQILLLQGLGLPVVATTPKGKPSFDKEAMKIYEEEYLGPSNKKEAKIILAYRGWQKATSAGYEPYQNLRSPDMLLRPNYQLPVTVTGRLSCRNPNLQQIPRQSDKPWNGAMKQCFIPRREGFRLIEFDYSQLEFRLSTHFAGQEELVAIFNDPERDIFSEIAKSLGLERQDAKTLVYAISYGAGARRIGNLLRVGDSGGKAVRDNFFGTYRNLLRASNFAAFHAQNDRRIRLWSGRYRNFLRPKDEAHKAYNSFIQGTAADLVERAMIRSAQFECDSALMLLQVHDSVIWEVEESQINQIVPAIANSMVSMGDEWSVKFKVDTHYFGGGKVDLALAA